ncbi:hydrogenase formation protein HypD [Helicobacter ailurogastricus]|uniref:[NiFe] hydrogenase metallocenter assembly protein HypD n=1 Tax=Helicobacter ailurogastricus TaxID=1578720 RepID=A0A0K2Y5G4_9HELI|nr:hydrogenase formation protein HypD [Helicobacter ailurogastricus]BDQ28553.1 hydrogenase expression/formation protein [Helicobacter ailurogastricus]CRF53084.1 [NiFe] hydrogenase metallocenter assembly protein HypD [Helicobacter ailurogastricus]
MTDFIGSFRDKDTILALVSQIKKESSKLQAPFKIMEVCGGHTHSLMRYGLLNLLQDTPLDFVHGPGCPVCVMPKLRIDEAIALAQMPDTILITLADLMRVPGSKLSLQGLRARGADVRFVYSPLQALEIATTNPHKKVVFVAIGFETTTPMTASLLLQAREKGLRNLFFHNNHVLVPPSVQAVLKNASINALIAPSHVSVITGAKIYQPLLDLFQIPIVVAGFEPVDMLDGILRIVRQALNKQALLEVQYSRVVSFAGNLKAQSLIAQTMQVRPSFAWRGLGEIPFSAMQVRPEFADFDAEVVFAKLLPKQSALEPKNCLCGQILKGLAKPLDCTLFNKACTPSHPVGACMVSAEGACAAYFKYLG